MRIMAKPSDDEPEDKKSSRRPSITAFLKTEDQKRLKLRLQRAFLDRKADGSLPDDTTFSEFVLQLLDAQLPPPATAATTQKLPAKSPAKLRR